MTAIIDSLRRGLPAGLPRPNAPSTGSPRSNATAISSCRTTKSVNRTLEAKTRALAGWKGYADVGVMPTSGVSCLVGVVAGLDSSA
jgi:hypothetical protein